MSNREWDAFLAGVRIGEALSDGMIAVQEDEAREEFDRWKTGACDECGLTDNHKMQCGQRPEGRQPVLSAVVQQYRGIAWF